MAGQYIQLDRIQFTGTTSKANVVFEPGVNVICGASDTGKSFLAEAIDFMLGGSTLKQVTERDTYSSAILRFSTGNNEHWQLTRALSGGNFELTRILTDGADSTTLLRQKHAQGKTDNISGFLLNKIGLLDKFILKSKVKGTTRSLSFRDVARLLVVQEGEIQRPTSPFLTGQHISKTAEIATIKLMLTGVDDSAVISTIDNSADGARELALIDELIADVSIEIGDIGHEKPDLITQSEALDNTLDAHRTTMLSFQSDLDSKINARKVVYDDWTSLSNRNTEITELLARFKLLETHYGVDKERLSAMVESGSLFAHLATVPCPLCGAASDAQHTDDKCEGDVDSVVVAAKAEMEKIERLLTELHQTVADLETEQANLRYTLAETRTLYETADTEIRSIMAPQVTEVRSRFVEVVEKRSEVQMAIGLFDRLEKLELKRHILIDDEAEPDTSNKLVESGIPVSKSHALSLTIGRILRAWNFPGACDVHFDNEQNDFIIDGKPRGSRGKGLRSITHAAITLAIMEFCKINSLPHPGFVVMDSPLLAYFKPEGEEDEALQGTDLKERFYQYLVDQHGQDSQVIIIENDHPPPHLESEMTITVFTRNPNEGRFGLL